jgi:acyl-CoA thioesterase-2
MLFVSAPSTRSPCTFTVESLRNGSRISYRSVGVSQGDRLVARATVTLTSENWISKSPGLEWAPLLPKVADPENLMTREELAAQAPDLPALEKLMLQGHPFLDIRLVPTQPDAPSRFWIRIPDAGTLEQVSQKALLTLISDFWFTLPVHAHPSARKAFGKDFLMTSIDHAIWLHGRPDCSEWILFEAQAPLVDGELAMLHAFAWSRLGAPLATVQQQALVLKQAPEARLR